MKRKPALMGGFLISSWAKFNSDDFSYRYHDPCPTEDHSQVGSDGESCAHGCNLLQRQLPH
jgi:hypothetical protein